jgi:hypothetical protein
MIDRMKAAGGAWKCAANDVRNSAGTAIPDTTSRRHLLRVAGLAGVGLATPAWANTVIQYARPLPGGPNERTLTTT